MKGVSLGTLPVNMLTYSQTQLQFSGRQKAFQKILLSQIHLWVRSRRRRKEFSRPLVFVVPRESTWEYWSGSTLRIRNRSMSLYRFLFVGGAFYMGQINQTFNTHVTWDQSHGVHRACYTHATLSTNGCASIWVELTKRWKKKSG